jgi:hypothetical protein
MRALVRFACSGRFKIYIFQFGWRGGLGMLHFGVGFVALVVLLRLVSAWQRQHHVANAVAIQNLMQGWCVCVLHVCADAAVFYA